MSCNGRALVSLGWICWLYEYSKYVDRLSNCKLVSEMSTFISNEHVLRLCI